jgi:hypothetical protein
MDKWLGLIIGVGFGLVLLVVGIVTPAFLWNSSPVMGLRQPMGDTITRILLIVAGIAILGGTLLKGRGKD